MKQQALERLFRLGSVQNLILMSFSEKSSQPKMANFSSNLSYMNDECVELLWDNCPIVMQDHPKSSFQTTFPPFHSRVQEKDDSKFDPLAKIEHFSAVEQKSNNFAGNAQAQDDDAFVRWIEDDYCSDFFNMNPINSQSIRSSSSDQAVFTNYSHHPEKVHPSKPNRVQLTPLFPFTESSEMDTNLEEDIDRSKRIKAMTSGAKSVLGIRQDEDVILAKQSNAVCEDDDNSSNKPYSSSPERKIQSSSFAENMTTLGEHKSDKGNNEVALDSTSICSDSNAVTAIAEQKRCDKKKLLLQREESGYQSDEDTEEKFTDLKKPDIVQGKSKKRSRMAEVHNLSERRRRDRINEKMRALQELIPNCNKNDKASTLDDAIEYLKSLQLQVQIMSMASSLCISPVMMQQVQALSNGSTHFSPMGIGMGMGIGCMGLYDLNAASGCSFIPVPPVQGPQGFAVTMPYQPPCASLAADTKTSSGTHTAPTSSEDKTLEELQKPNTVDDLQNIHSTKALKEYGKRSSMTHLSDLPSLTSF